MLFLKFYTFLFSQNSGFFDSWTESMSLKIPFKIARKGEFGHRLEDLLILVGLWELLDDPRLLVGLRFCNLAEALEEMFGSLSETFGHRHKTAKHCRTEYPDRRGSFVSCQKKSPAESRVPLEPIDPPHNQNFNSKASQQLSPRSKRSVAR